MQAFLLVNKLNLVKRKMHFSIKVFNQACHFRKLQKGFTLIELLIVLVIVAILVMVAVPTYQEQVQRGKRAEGKAFLLDLASRQERFYTQYAKYTSVASGGNCPGEGCGLGMDDNESPEGRYEATIDCLPDDGTCTSYTITATPQTPDDRCTTLTYTSAGVKGSTGTGTVDYCWR